ncbi:hypothetical protein LOTGIDRAFT_210667 [Lottia gigantea]|uniref:Prefoldin subunit 6 n=1 Tax=Lottia gigantea TaxID=225164 RepID=V3ZSB5_LOTGI|nr:hypothetical protein LOTGIDRAFT_210667 [Lottia gigantea]ESO87262.1 hypothetical protein LOTGIDRAFT_210667 [Lottia gigantea]
MSEGLQKRLETEIEKFQSCQKDLQKYITSRQKLEAQLSENTLVKTELDLIKDDGTVFKMIGPVLVKQELEEAKQNVQKRIDYINGEIKRHEGLIKDVEKKQEAHKESLSKLQHQYQQAQVKAATKA